MRVVLLGGAPGVGKTTTARRLMEFAQAGPDLVQWVDVDALWFHRPWRVDERTKAMVEANIRAVADHAAQAGVDVLLITWVFHKAEVHRIVAGLLPPGSEITTVQLHAGHEVWARRYMGDPERGGGPLARHEEGYTQTHAVPVDHVVKTDGLTPIEVADAVALAIGGALARRADQGASLAQTGAITRVAGPDSRVTPWAEPHSSGLSRGRTTVRVATSPWPRPLVTVPEAKFLTRINILDVNARFTQGIANNRLHLVRIDGRKPFCSSYQVVYDFGDITFIVFLTH